MNLLLTVFLDGLELTGRQRFLLLLPLCLSIAIVYKATRCEKIADLPLASLGLWTTIVIGMLAVGAALWILYLIAV